LRGPSPRSEAARTFRGLAEIKTNDISDLNELMARVREAVDLCLEAKP